MSIERAVPATHTCVGVSIYAAIPNDKAGYVSLTGTFSTMALGDLLQWIEQGRKTGTLTVQGERYVKKIVLSEGRVVASNSNDPNDHLGHFLLRLGLISEPDLRRAMQTQQQTRAMLGRILVTIGAVTEEALQETLHQKAEETIFSLFLWREARFEFHPGKVPATLSVPLNLEIGDILMKGLTWYDELQHIREVFASNRTVIRRTDCPVPEALSAGESLERRILDLVDGNRCIADICLAVHASEFVVSRALHAFSEDGLVTAIGKETPARTPPRKTFNGLVEEARSLLRAGEVEAALKVINEARPLCPHDFTLNTLAREAQDSFARRVYRSGLKPTMVPVLVRSLESLTGERLTPEQMFILSRVDGSWDISSIVSVCPFPEAEALIHLTGLKESGILEMHEVKEMA